MREQNISVNKILTKLFLLSLFFLPSVALADSDAYQKLNSTDQIFYQGDTGLILKWDTSCSNNETFYFRKKGSEEMVRTAICYTKSFSTDRACQMAIGTLSPSTTYRYGHSCDSADRVYYDYFTTPSKFGDKKIRISKITYHSAEISWTTPRPLGSKVFCSPSANDFDQDKKPTKTKNHSTVLTDLKPSTTYQCQVSSVDKNGGVVSELLDFTTPQDKLAASRLKKITANCRAVQNSVFLSVEKKDMYPDFEGKMLKSNWKITFRSGQELQWDYKDVAAGGTYACTEDGLRVNFYQRVIEAKYNPKTKILTWDKVAYKKKELKKADMAKRDARRLSDLRKIQLSLSKYFEANGSYPPGSGDFLGYKSLRCLNKTGFTYANCANPYMKLVPGDPLYEADPWFEDKKYAYAYFGATSTYRISATLEGGKGGLSGSIRMTPEGIQVD